MNKIVVPKRKLKVLYFFYHQ